MTWTKLTDTAADDPIFLTVPRGARLLHVEALCWSNRHGAGGRIPAGALSRLTDEPDPAAAAAALVAAGLWETAEDGWQLVWLLDDQPTPEDAARVRAMAAARQRRRRQHKSGDHSLCDPDYCRAVTRDVTDPSRVSHASPSRPVPTRPVPSPSIDGREGGKGRSGNGAASTSEPSGDGPRGLAPKVEAAYRAATHGKRITRPALVALLEAAGDEEHAIAALQAVADRGVTDADQVIMDAHRYLAQPA